MLEDFRPFNRHILIEKIEEATSGKPVVLVPDEYQIQSKHCICEVVKLADSCTIDLFPGEVVVVETSMIQEITVNDAKYYLVLENYVFGSLGG